MDTKDAFNYLAELVRTGVPYKEKPPFNLSEGFNCFGWVMFLRNYLNNETNDIYYDINNLKTLGDNFERTDGPLKYLDMPMFYLNTIEPRHIGLMLDNQYLTQCSYSTNGVSIANINNQPWKCLLKGAYRHK